MSLRSWPTAGPAVRNALGARSALLVVVMTLAVLIHGQLLFRNVPLIGDTPYFNYIAQVIARGGVKYRDAVDSKAPLSEYIGAAAIAVTRPFGLRDLLATRLMFTLLAVLTVALTFVVVSDYFGSRRVASLASLIMLNFHSLALWTASGIEPKVPMILFGLLVLWAIHRDRPFLAGLFGTLSALNWQPGLLFVAVAVLSYTRYFTRWRGRDLWRLGCGAALPMAVVVTYFWAVGALYDLYAWTIHYNFTVYGPQEARRGSPLLARAGRVIQRDYANDWIYFYLAAGGVLAILTHLKRSRVAHLRDVTELAPRHAILLAPLVYLAFCVINFQGGRDLIPLLPFVAAFAAFCVLRVGQLLGQALAHFTSKPRPSAFQDLIFVGACVVVLGTALSEAFSVKFARGLTTQEAAVAEISAHLAPGDTIYVHKATDVLVLSGHSNASEHFLLDHGKHSYLDLVEPGGFAGWFARLKAERPKVVVPSSLPSGTLRSQFENWLRDGYDRHEQSTGRMYYVRKN
jgi:hypothetical protein